MNGRENMNEESEAYLTTQLLTYLGNKRSLLRFIGDCVDTVKRELGKDRITFFDAFSGSGVVSRFMKRHASLIVANDLERYSEVENRCYLTNRSAIDEAELDAVFREWTAYASAHRVEGFVAKLYAPNDDDAIQKGERVFYTHANAVTLDSGSLLRRRYTRTRPASSRGSTRTGAG